MATIMHKSELVRRALVYLDERMAAKPGTSIHELLDEAGMRFNLAPKDAADLERFFVEAHRECKNKK